MKKSYFLFCLISILLFACSGSELEDSDPTPSPENPIKIPINISTQMWTRATDTAFEKNDKTGIYVVNYKDTNPQSLLTTGNHVDNMEFTYSSEWEPASPIYWIDNETHADFYCYYPYTQDIADVNAYPFTVKSDQSNMADYKASDFMWAKQGDVAPTPDPVQINVKHVMSNLIIKLVAGKGYTAEDLTKATVTLCGLKNEATINLSTGIATATGETTNIIPLKENDAYRALIVPQDVEKVDLVKIDIDNKSYKLTQSMKFEAHKQHTCTVTIDKVNEGINIGIDGWNTDDVDHGGTAQ